MTTRAWRLGDWGWLAILACAMGVAVAAAPQFMDRTSLRQAILAAEDARAPSAEDVRKLLRAASGRDEGIAVAAVRALGRLERPALAGDLIAFVDVKSPLVRAEAANAIGQSVAEEKGDAAARARKVLVSRLATETDLRVRGIICETLGRLPLTTADVVRGVEAALVDASLQTGPGVTARPSTTTTALGSPVAGVTIGFGTLDRNAPLPVLLGAAKGLESLIRQQLETSPPGGRTVARLRRLIETARPPRDVPAAEAGAGEVVGRPDRLPWRQVAAAVFAQLRPLREVGHLRGAQQQPLAARHKRGRPAGWQTK